MVRTARSAIRISAAKSSKKVSGGSAPSTPSSSGSKAGSSSLKLPPIPFQETPSWQKPITNFFKATSPLKEKEVKNEKDEEKNNLNNDEDKNDAIAGPSTKKLKLDSEEIGSDNDKNTEVKENDNEKSEVALEANKENALKITTEFDGQAGSSKD